MADLRARTTLGAYSSVLTFPAPHVCWVNLDIENYKRLDHRQRWGMYTPGTPPLSFSQLQWPFFRAVPSLNPSHLEEESSVMFIEPISQFHGRRNSFYWNSFSSVSISLGFLGVKNTIHWGKPFWKPIFMAFSLTVPNHGHVCTNISYPELSHHMKLT